MIVFDEQAPRWLRELGRFLPLKSLFFLDGNINDFVSYPVRDEKGNVYWVETLLRPFFERLFQGLGYQMVGFIDPLEELQFVTPKMMTRFREVNQIASPAVSAPGQAPAVVEPPVQPCSSGTRRPPDWNRTIEQIGTAMRDPKAGCAFVIQSASRLVSGPDLLDDTQRALFSKLLRLSLEAPVSSAGGCNNIVVIICDKLNDLPPFLYLNNPRARSIHLDLPDRQDRLRFARQAWPAFHGGSAPGEEVPESALDEFADLTDGLTQYELRSLVRLSKYESIPVRHPLTGAPNVRSIIEKFKYGVTESGWERIDEKVESAPAVLRASIHGQDEAVERVLEVICRARFGLAAGEGHRANRPRGVLFFAGPTGVGKTEMAKSLARALLGDADRLIRFDMSEYRAEHADQRLLGAPPGYVGYNEGGQLTDAVKKQPFSLLLFDEIEKAHPLILDKFLQILDDGRLTDGRGETAYFSECLMIFTSNLGILPLSGDEEAISHKTHSHAEMREIVLHRIGQYFKLHLGRPELLNRFGDSFVVFDFIRTPFHAGIVRRMVDLLVSSVAERGMLRLSIDEAVYEQLTTLAEDKLDDGGRGIRNLIDAMLVNPLARALAEQRVQQPATVNIRQIVLPGEDGGRPRLNLDWET